MKNKLLFLLFIFLLIPGILPAAEMHTLDIEFAFSNPDNPASELMGYRLYKEGDPVCETDDPGATRITCEFFTEDGTFDFTLTALYAYDTESPHSPAFPFTIIASIPDPTVDNFTISAINDQVYGVPFEITVEARDSSDALATWFTGTAGISDTTGSITPGTTGNFSNGIWSGNITINSDASDVNITIQNGTPSGTSNSFDVNAPPQVLSRIEITPPTATVLTDAQQQYTAQAYDTANKSMAVDFTWTVVKGGGTINQNGLFTAGSIAGDYSNTVKVSAESITVTASVTVTEKPVAHFTINDISDQINGIPFQITVEARDSSDALATWFTGTASISDTTGSITPSTTSNFSNGTWSGNVIINSEASNVNITIQNDTSSGTSNPFDVNAPPQVLSRIEITPSTATILTAGQQQFTAQGFDTANNPMTVDFTWAVANGGTIDQNGLFTAGSTAGDYNNTVKVSAESITATASVTVTEKPVAHFTINDISDQINGIPFQITVEARDSSGAIATWFTGTAGLSDTTGTMTPGTTGNFSNGRWSGNVTINSEASNVNITIQNGTSSGTSNSFDVNAPPRVLSRIEITPPTATVLTDAQQQFSAKGYDTANKAMTVAFTWAVVNGGTIDQNGLFTAGSVTGSYSNTVKVSAESITAAASITVTEPQPPTAVLSSSPTMGDASLTVDFDGSASTTPNLSIVSHSWNFGDGEHATGKTVSHTYTETGGYTAELTVRDNLGLTSTAKTPILVTEAVVLNEKPIAAISVDPPQSDAPLTVSLDGSQSSDPDGTITKYKWNFGDGTTGNSQAVKHTYTEAAVYTVSLEVTDDQGDTAEATKDVFFNVELPGDLNFEVGKVTIDHQWVKVLFENSFIDPVVIAGPPTNNGNDPVLIRIRNIDQDGFEIRLQEWDYLDGSHTDETFSYIVMEKGINTLYNGIKVEAGNFTGSSRFKKISLQQPYDLTPVILTQIITENEADAVTGRIRKSGLTSFEYKLQEMEKTKRNHTTETIGYIAWEPGIGELSGILYEAGLTPDSVTHNWFDLIFQTDFPELPLFIANMQTQDGGDTAVLRSQNMSPVGTQIKIEEEQSKDEETRHTSEVVGYLIIGSKAE